MWIHRDRQIFSEMEIKRWKLRDVDWVLNISFLFIFLAVCPIDKYEINTALDKYHKSRTKDDLQVDSFDWPPLKLLNDKGT